jgi:hypothetical protein
MSGIGFYANIDMVAYSSTLDRSLLFVMVFLSVNILLPKKFKQNTALSFVTFIFRSNSLVWFAVEVP